MRRNLTHWRSGDHVDMVFKISRKTAAAEYANESELNEGLCSITFVVKISSFRTAEFFSCVEKLYLKCNWNVFLITMAFLQIHYSFSAYRVAIADVSYFSRSQEGTKATAGGSIFSFFPWRDIKKLMCFRQCVHAYVLYALTLWTSSRV